MATTENTRPTDSIAPEAAAIYQVVPVTLMWVLAPAVCDELVGPENVTYQDAPVHEVLGLLSCRCAHLDLVTQQISN
jgi:hypothetical protein